MISIGTNMPGHPFSPHDTGNYLLDTLLKQEYHPIASTLIKSFSQSASSSMYNLPINKKRSCLSQQAISILINTFQGRQQ